MENSGETSKELVKVVCESCGGTTLEHLVEERIMFDVNVVVSAPCRTCKGKGYLEFELFNQMKQTQTFVHLVVVPDFLDGTTKIAIPYKEYLEMVKYRREAEETN